MNILHLISVIFLTSACVFSEEIPQHSLAFYAERTQALTYTNPAGESLNYRLFLPNDYDGTKKYPFVLVFHGAGERGDDNRKQLAAYTAGWIDDTNQDKHPCILLIPQCPTGQKWVNVLWKNGS